MDTNGIPKQALRYRPKGRRNLGRTKKRWRDQLHFEDQGKGNTPNPSGTWWWWWWWVSVAIQVYREPVQVPAKNLFRFPLLKIFTHNRKDLLSIAVRFGLDLKKGLIFRPTINDTEQKEKNKWNIARRPRPLADRRAPVTFTAPPPLVCTVAISSPNTLKKKSVSCHALCCWQGTSLINLLCSSFFIWLDAIFDCQQKVISQPSCVVIQLSHPDSS